MNSSRFSLSHLSVRVRLFLLVLAGAVPFGGALAYHVLSKAAEAQEDARSRVKVVADAVAGNLDLILRDNEAMMARLASRPLVKAMDPSQCDPLFAEYVTVNEEFNTLGVRDTRGNIVCSHRPMPEAYRQLLPEQNPWLALGLQADSYRVGDAFLGFLASRWVSILTYPVRNDQGEQTGLLALPMDLLNLNNRVLGNLPEGIVVTVRDATGRTLLYSAQPEKWVGAVIPAAAPDEVAAQRIVAAAAVPTSGWQVSAGVLQTEVLAPYLVLRNRSIALASGLMLLVLGIAWRIAAGIIKPVNALADVASRIADGDSGARVSEDGPAELGAMAHQFNRMVDARLQAEESVREGEARFSAAFEYAPVGMSINSPEGKWLWVNRALCDFFGLSRHELMVTNWQQLTHPDDLALDLAYGVPLLNGEATNYQLEKRYFHRDGRVVWGLLSVSLLRTDDGVPRFFCAQIVDISPRKAAERALEVTAERLDLAVAATRLGLWDWDITTGLVASNDTMAQLCGYAPEEMTPGTYELWNALGHPDDLRANGPQLRDNLAGRSDHYETEQRLKHKLGYWIWVLNKGRVTARDEAGRALRMIGTFQDITQRKETELRLRRSERVSAKAEELAGIGSWDWSLVGDYSYWSDELFRIYGRRKEDGTPGFDAWEETIHPEDRNYLLTRMSQVHAAKSSYAAEFRIFRKDSRELRYLDSRGESVENLAGKVTHVWGVDQDITDRKRAQHALEAINRELARSNAELEQFAYVASHDLQEPLRSVSSCVQLLQKRYGSVLDARADEFIEHAVSGSHRMQALIDDLLACSRVNAMPRSFSSVDSARALDVACANLAGARADSKAEITQDLLPLVYADEAQLVQLFQNLVGNALKFSGDRPARVHVSATAKDREWVFSIADQGIGIDPQYFPRIFKLFQRLHTREEYSGTGVGLTISQKIVERHGGRIWVESSPGVGAVFYFTLPREELSVRSLS